MDIYNNYVDSGIQYTIDTCNSTFSLSPSTSTENPVKKSDNKKIQTVRHAAWTPEWLIQQIKEDPIPQVIGNLRAWMPSHREREITEQTVMEIWQLETKDAIIAVNSFKDK